jgi:hypothetical protein
MFLMLDIVALSFVLAGASVGLGVGFLSARAALARHAKTRVVASLFMKPSVVVDDARLQPPVAC